MAVLTRLGRLFRADLHAALDQLEEPEQTLRQALRDMEEQLDLAAQQLRSAEQEQRDLQARRAELQAAQPRLNEELDLCFASGNEPLQRLLLRRRLESERLHNHWLQQETRLQRSIDQQREQIAEQRQRWQHVRERAELYASRTTDPLDASGAAPVAVSEADVELALLRERAARSGS